MGSGLELQERGYEVVIVDKVDIDNEAPDPYASSEDVSKIVRPDYAERESLFL